MTVSVNSNSHSNIVKTLVEQNRFDSLFILARFMYRVGSPIINDSKYNMIENKFLEVGYLKEYTSRTYDDDPIPYKLLREFNLENYIPKDLVSSKYIEHFDKDKSLSIQPLTEYKDIYNFVMEKQQDLVVMLKVDGINVKNLYKHQNLELSMSRGRNGNGFDLTRNTSKVLPNKIKSEYDELKITLESFVYENVLPYFRNKYDSEKYKTSKSAGISLLRVPHDLEDYKYLGALAFNIEGAIHLKTKMESLAYLKELGFVVVPHILVKWETIPRDYETFKIWLNKLCKMFYVKTQALPSDGLVFEVNDLDYVDNVNNQYSNKNIAVKLSYWGFDKYIGTVEDIIIEQQRVIASCRIKIKPLRTKDGCEATYINSYNPSILINNNINIGSEVIFERNSGAINSLLYGDKLKE